MYINDQNVNLSLKKNTINERTVKDTASMLANFPLRYIYSLRTPYLK